MGFIYDDDTIRGGEGGEGGGVIEAPVKSVNGKTGHVFLSYKDLNAVRNLQGSVGGLQVGSMVELPRTPDNNTVFISTNKVPNSIYLYTRNRWERIGGEEEAIDAIAIQFNSLNIEGTNATNVQRALEDAFYQIDINEKDFMLELDKIHSNIGELSKKDGKIKLTEYDRLDFLENKLSKTLAVEGNILTVKGIQGLLSTIEELNQLVGIKGNVQNQIDRLSRIGGLATTVPTYADLVKLDDENVEVNDLVVVQKDETKEDKITLYMLSKSRNWEYLGTFKADVEIRDFELDPVKLESEVTGVLSEENIDSVIVRRPELEELKNLIQIESTDDVPEGRKNKYYTDNKVDNRINSNIKVKTAFEKAHEHFNKEIIDELGETDDGLLTFRGEIVSLPSEDNGGESGEDPSPSPEPVESDGRVKISAQDVLGYLGTKIDGNTIEVENNKLTAKTLKGMIASIEEINRLTGIKDNIQKQLDKIGGTVQLDDSDTAGYLGTKIDKDTIVVNKGKLMANRLNGQTVTISELNYSKGLKGNIQEQIDALNRVGSFTAIVDSYAELDTIKNPLNGDLVMVSSDETQEGITTFYMYERGQWKYGGNFHIEIRNFETEPIRLDKEVAGTLGQDKIDENIVRKEQMDEAIKEIKDSFPKDTDELPEGRENQYYKDEKVSKHSDVKQNTENRHNHDNLEVIDMISEDEDGRLIYKGKELSVLGEIEWNDF